jgi:hypothetical protein
MKAKSSGNKLMRHLYSLTKSQAAERKDEAATYKQSRVVLAPGFFEPCLPTDAFKVPVDSGFMKSNTTVIGCWCARLNYLSPKSFITAANEPMSRASS